MKKSINELSFTLSEVKQDWLYEEFDECYSIEADIHGITSDIVFYPENNKLEIHYADEVTLNTTLETFSANPDKNESIIDELIIDQCNLDEQIRLNEAVSNY